MTRCFHCGCELTADDIGAYMKLINRGAQEFLCVPCLAKELKVDDGEIRRKIEQFKKSGCTLFN